MKAKFLALAALLVGMAACQTDPNGLELDRNGEAAVTLNVGLPNGETRAAGTNSALGAIDNGIDLNEYDIRFILEVYDANGELAKDRMVKVGDATEAAFNFRLVPGRNYKFVVWADFVANNSTAETVQDLHYETTNGLRLVAIKDWTAIDESRDAYTAAVDVEDYSGASQIEPIVLTRPFAKLRVVTNDIKEMITLRPEIVKVNYFDTKFYTAFDAFAENPINQSYTGHELIVDLKEDFYTNENPNKTGEQTLFADYFFAKEGDDVKFSMDVVFNDGSDLPTVMFNTNIPVKRNNLTTVYGPILTDANNVTVKIDPAFEAEHIYLQGDVTLTEDLVLDRPMVVLTGTSAVLDLNGHSIINNTKSETFGEGEGIIVYGELDIIGEGTVQGSTMAVWARGDADAVVNIYGGTFLGCEEGFAKGGRSVIYASSGNVVNIYGGTFKALSVDTTSYNRASAQGGLYAALNVADNNGMINVSGGSFYKQNPAAPLTEPTSWDTTHPNGFLAEDCVVETDGDWFNVIYDPYYGYAKVASLGELTTAINNATGDINIVFLNDIEGDVTLKHKTNGKITINGDGKTYTGKMTLNSDVTIKNVNFDGKGYDGYAIETRGANYLTIEDCTAKNYGYGFVQLASGTALTTVKNVTVSNMNYGVKVDYSNAVVIENADINVGVAAVLNSNYGEKPITIKNSKFNILGTWKRNNTTKTNYVFEGNNTIDTFKIEAALDNFKLAAGATLTAPNEINVTTVAGYTVEYADGKYISK